MLVGVADRMPRRSPRGDPRRPLRGAVREACPRGLSARAGCSTARCALYVQRTYVCHLPWERPGLVARLVREGRVLHSALRFVHTRMYVRFAFVRGSDLAWLPESRAARSEHGASPE